MSTRTVLARPFAVCALVATVAVSLAIPAVSPTYADDLPAPTVSEFGENPNPETLTEEVVPEGDNGNADLVTEQDSVRELRIAAETAHAFGSELSNDRKGFRESLYQGKWYMPAREDRRQCISKREAHHNYGAVSSGGLYRGVYQFSGALARGATWMMQPEVRKEMGEAGVNLVQELRKTPMNQWNRYWQDRAFWTIWAKGRGSHHWHGGSRGC